LSVGRCRDGGRVRPIGARTVARSRPERGSNGSKPRVTHANEHNASRAPRRYDVLMATGASIHHVDLVLSDVDRGVYETLGAHLARHPSESMRFLATRLLAYALSYEEGIAFSKGGVSSADEPPVSVRDLTGRLRVWIDIGSPAAARLHKATKAAERVELYTAADIAYLTPESIHRKGDIAVFRLDPKLVDALGGRLDRRVSLEIVRNDGRLYITTPSGLIEGAIARTHL
jgi:uncharacterized protein YaeQ